MCREREWRRQGDSPSSLAEPGEERVERLHRARTVVALAVDEQGRRRIDTQRRAALLLNEDRLQPLLIVEAGPGLRLAQSGQPQRLDQGGQGILVGHPLRLALEDGG